MGVQVRTVAALVVTAALLAPGSGARAQGFQVVLPTIDVSSSRQGGAIVGTSSSVITAEDIRQSAAQDLPQILSQQAGIQIQHIGAGVNGARDVVDLRGFGASATSNVLVLVNGRRFNDFDLQGFDFSSIPLNSIARIEITRGNPGAVLYGDGAVGGVINIVTKNGVGAKPNARVEGSFGSFRDREGRVSAAGSSGPFSAAFNGVTIRTDGYRENSQLRQNGFNGDLRYTATDGSVYFNVGADDQKLGLPGGRLVDPSAGIDQLATDRRGAATPNDYANKQGQNYTLGVTRMLTPELELIVDGSLRRKAQQAELFYLGSPYNGVDTKLTTTSVTPRLKFDGSALGTPTKILAGFDYYHTAYNSDRAKDLVSLPYHQYDIKQSTAGFYANGTFTVRPDTDVTLGGRAQYNTLSARDTYDPTAPFGFGDAQGLPLDRNEWQWAAQLGAEHRFNVMFAVFGHVAHSFRVPNADERIGQAVAFNFPTPTPTNFDLKTQTSNEVEAGLRFRRDGFTLQSSVYDIELHDEVFYSPATGTNVNLDPTRHWGVETSASWRVNDTVKLTGNVTYTRAIFREGQFAGSDIPLISRWTGNVGLTWNILDKRIVYDAMLRYAGERRLDNDSANVQPLIPAYTTVDMRIGGEVKNITWSFAVQNVFNAMYYDYGIASTFTAGRYNAYPQPGRTFMARLGVALD